MTIKAIRMPYDRADFTMKRQPYIKSSNLKERTGSFLSMPPFENRRKMMMGKS